ncbi:MAG: right-handed parallel beta-helix repeat-containing protein [Dehalococcoidales bacterium]|nr:right-handed parallel beta-helix repeat-containing protein [Dehalococcoidales bacterium]
MKGSKLFSKLFRLVMAGIMVISMFAVTATPASAEGAVLNVGPTETYKTIYAALEAANDGDTIMVSPNGTSSYKERVVIVQPLTIQGIGLPVVEAIAQYEPVFDIQCDNVTLNGFDIRGDESYGINMEWPDNCLIVNNEISGCDYGINIGYWNEENPALDNAILNNTFMQNNRGIEMFEHAGGTVITGNTFDSNVDMDVHFGPFNIGENIVHHNDFAQEGKCFEDTDNTSPYYLGPNVWYDIGSNEGNTWGPDTVPIPYYILSTEFHQTLDPGEKTNKDPYPLNGAAGPPAINVPLDYATIQKAVDAASPDDVIIVAAGQYKENVLVNKPVIIKGEWQIGQEGPSVNLTANQSGQHVFEVTADNVSIEGMGIYGGFCGVYAVSVNNLVIAGNDIQDGDFSVYLELCGNATVLHNLLRGTGTAGLWVQAGAGGHEIYENKFDNNPQDMRLFGTIDTPVKIHHNGFVQGGLCIDDSLDPNIWYDAYLHEGNYWDDYTGEDTNPQDGIGDDPYPILDSYDYIFAWDMFPLMNPPSEEPEGKPDLYIAEKHEEWVNEGEGTYQVVYIVGNQGTAPAPLGFMYQVKIDSANLTPPMPFPEEVSVGEYIQFRSAIATLTESSDTITVCLDIYNDVEELDEDNNCATNTWEHQTQDKPDLVIYDKYEEWVDMDAGNYTITFTVKNIGTANASAGHYAGIKIDGSVFQEIEVTDILEPGEWVIFTSNEKTISDGTDNISVGADVTFVIDESNEDNNQMENIWTLQTPEKPDLEVTDKHEEWVSELDGTYVIYFTVTNFGPVDAPAGHEVMVNVNGTPVQQIPVDVILGSGENFTSNTTIQTMVVDFGESVNITVCADCHGFIDEIYEDNNCMENTWYRTGEGPKPDLIIDEKHEVWVEEGQTFRVFFTVKNVGDAEAMPGHTVGIEVNGVNLQQVVVPAVLPSGNFWTGNTTAFPLTYETDNITVCADIYNTVLELDEHNNCMENKWPEPEPPAIHVPGDYGTIQAAVDAASPYDVIIVGAGDYEECVTVWKPLVIKGEWQEGQDRPVANVTANVSYNPVFKVTSNEVCLEGMEISGGNYGVHVDAFNRVKIEGNDIHDNLGGIYLSDVENITVRHNRLAFNNQGLYLWSGTGVYIYENKFDTNSVNDLVLASNGVTAPVEIHHNGFKQGGTCVDDSGFGSGVRWYDEISEEGNHWGDYDGVDEVEPFGIGDSPYHINNSSGAPANADIYPLMEPPALKVRIEAPEIVPVSGNFTAKVAIDYIENLSAVQYDIYFNPAVLELTGFMDGDLDGTPVPVPTGEIAPNELEPGHWRVVQVIYPAAAAVNGTGYLSQIQFHVIGETGNTSCIDLADGVLSGLYGEIHAEWVGHEVEVGDVGKQGDVNGDGNVNALDMTKLARIILEMDPWVPAADVNGDGNTNVLDMTYIALIILELV